MSKKINVLSLFNGMSFGMMALETCGIEVDKYYSSEIDKYANQATKALYPDIIQLGDVTKWDDWDIDLGEIDLLIAGFPCQAWSIAGRQEGDNDPRGALVHDLIAIWEEINITRELIGEPPVKFMFENVKMKKEFLDYINELFGVEPVCINSALVSAQNRVRYYWTNIGEIEQPKDRKLTIKNIMTDFKEITDRVIAKPVGTSTHRNTWKNMVTINDKSKCLTASGQNISNASCTNIEINGRYYGLTLKECAKLQTVPESHTNTLLSAGISNTQLNKMLGNGWTHDVIVHIFKSLHSWSNL